MITPDFTGQYYRDTTTGAIWKSNSTTPGDWSLAVQDMQVAWTPTNLKLGDVMGYMILADVPETSITFNSITAGLIDIENTSTPTAISAPNILSLDATNVFGGYLTIQLNAGLLSASFPKLNLTGTGIRIKQNVAMTSLDLSGLVTTPYLDIGQNDSLVTLNLDSLVNSDGFISALNLSIVSMSLPSLVTMVNGCNISSCPLLTTFSAPNWVPTDNQTYSLGADALNAASVEGILRRFVLAGVTSTTLILNGGTNAGLASLNAQGQADAAALFGQVTLNA